MDQIEQYDPPPNPAKLTDSRGEAYVEEYGDDSWELDALRPETLIELIKSEIKSEIDPGPWAEAQETERAAIAEMDHLGDLITDRVDEVIEYLESN
jgi:hypothetical protein